MKLLWNLLSQHSAAVTLINIPAPAPAPIRAPKALHLFNSGEPGGECQALNQSPVQTIEI